MLALNHAMRPRGAVPHDQANIQLLPANLPVDGFVRKVIVVMRACDGALGAHSRAIGLNLLGITHG